MQQVLFASSNKYKLEQFQYVADAYALDVKIVSVYAKFPGVNPYDEEYETQFEIIEKGAREIYAQIEYPVIVEDTILEVDILGGLPGLHASDFLRTKGRMGLGRLCRVNLIVRRKSLRWSAITMERSSSPVKTSWGVILLRKKATKRVNRLG